ncbi:MAG: hypothetical protein WCL00_01625 [Bacteroidota bacterium]
MKRKFAFSLILSLLFSAIVGAFAGPVIGIASFASSLIPKPAGIAMMGLQREVWLPSLQEQYEQKRDWMDGLSDLSMFVDNNQTLHFAEVGDYPAVYKNRTTDVDSVEPSETPSSVDLDTYDSQNYKIRKIGLYAIPYAKVEAYTRQSAEAIRLQEAKACAYAISPDASGTKKIVLPTTGKDNGSGLARMTLEDVQKLAQAFDLNKFPEAETGRYLVLTTNMWWELVMSNELLKAQIGFQQSIGTIDPKVVNYYGFKIYRYDAGVGYDISGSAKAAEGAVITGNIRPMSFAFCTREAFKASGLFSMFDKPIQQNTSGRAYEFGFQHRFKSGMLRANLKYTAGIYHADATV